MDAPSNELKGLANAPKADLEAILLNWAKLWKGLRIVSWWFTSSSSLAEVTGFTHDEGADDKELIFELHLYATKQELIAGKTTGQILPVFFYTNNKASIMDSDFLGVPPTFHGTWEEVTRSLFEMEKEMLSQIPEVPEDLKKQE